MIDRACLRRALTVIGAVTLAGSSVGERDQAESRAIAVVRAITSGERAYAAFSDGYYATLERLTESTCTVRFLAPSLTTPTKDGYRFQFHPGAAAPSPDGEALTSFAVVAEPVTASTRRHRAFCADDRQVIYVTDHAMTPRVEGGRCVDTGHPLGHTR